MPSDRWRGACRDQSRCGWELLLSEIGQRHDAAKLNVTSSLRELLEPEFAQYL